MARPDWRRTLIGVAVAALLLAVTTVAATAVLSVRVTGSSMRPALHDGDRVVVDPFADRPRRFDLVAARFAESGPLAVKRVIGLPGDRVRIAVRLPGAGAAAGPDPGPDAGAGAGPDVGADTAAPAVLVRPGGVGPWQRVHNPAWQDQWRRLAPMDETVVPDGSLFLLGDNPDGSEDSRQLGVAPQRLVHGTVRLRVYPLSALGRPSGGASLQPFQADG